MAGGTLFSACVALLAAGAGVPKSEAIELPADVKCSARICRPAWHQGPMSLVTRRRIFFHMFLLDSLW